MPLHASVFTSSTFMPGGTGLRIAIIPLTEPCDSAMAETDALRRALFDSQDFGIGIHTKKRS